MEHLGYTGCLIGILILIIVYYNPHITALKLNSEFTPEKWCLEDYYFPSEKVTFQGRTVKLWGGRTFANLQYVVNVVT